MRAVNSSIVANLGIEPEEPLALIVSARARHASCEHSLLIARGIHDNGVCAKPCLDLAGQLLYGY